MRSPARLPTVDNEICTGHIGYAPILTENHIMKEVTAHTYLNAIAISESV